MGFNVISRLRDDVRLKYLYTGPKTGKRGRPKKFTGPVDLKSLDKSVFETITLEGVTLHSAVVWAVSLKREVKVVIADYIDPEKKTQSRKVFFSTDTGMNAMDILKFTGQDSRSSFSTEIASNSRDCATASQGMPKQWTLHSTCLSPQSTLPDSLGRTMAWICPSAMSSCSYTMLQWLNEYFQRSEKART